MKGSHVFAPKNIAILESEDRRLWQNPDELLGAVEIRSHFMAADLGCGSGYFTLPLARRVKKVYGIDVQKEMLGFLEDKMNKLKVRNIESLLSKPDETPLENESVDLLISVNTPHEFDDKERVIREMERVVKRGGKLLIVDFKKKETGFGPPVNIRVSKNRAIRLVEKKVFALLKVKELPYHYLLVFAKQ